MPGKGYEFFEHTADVGLRAYGATLPELFVHAAQGLIELLVERSPVAAKETRPVALAASSVDALLRVWLTELLFWFSADRFLPAAYRLETVTDTEVHGTISGEQFDPSRHAQGTEVKGLTYHEFRIQRTGHGWEASMIFDV